MKQPQQLSVEERLCTCGGRKLHVVLFCRILQDGKLLGKTYEDYFIDKLQPILREHAYFHSVDIRSSFLNLEIDVQNLTLCLSTYQVNITK